jgi:hypothetical protein
MSLLALALFITAAAATIYGAEWHGNLSPGITRPEIPQIACAPTSTKSQRKPNDLQNGASEFLTKMDLHDLKEGYLELTHENDALLGCARHS